MAAASAAAAAEANGESKDEFLIRYAQLLDASPPALAPKANFDLTVCCLQRRRAGAARRSQGDEGRIGPRQGQGRGHHPEGNLLMSSPSKLPSPLPIY